MNTHPFSFPQRRFPCAAVAVLASTLVLSSVLWLFASAGAPAAAASTALVKHQPASPSARPVSGRPATHSTAMARL
jgi:hypothetical protein